MAHDAQSSLDMQITEWQVCPLVAPKSYPCLSGSDGPAISYSSFYNISPNGLVRKITPSVNWPGRRCSVASVLPQEWQSQPSSSTRRCVPTDLPLVTLVLQIFSHIVLSGNLQLDKAYQASLKGIFFSNFRGEALEVHLCYDRMYGVSYMPVGEKTSRFRSKNQCPTNLSSTFSSLLKIQLRLMVAIRVTPHEFAQLCCVQLWYVHHQCTSRLCIYD